MKIVFRLLRVAGAVLFGCAALAAVRMAAADTIFRLDTASAIRRAIALQGSAPAAEYQLRLAEVDPSGAHLALERATAANPRSSAAWIALGLFDDASGSRIAAGRALLQAAEADRRYLPAWTLTNFYFRAGNREAFWRWADRTASLSYDDFRPLARLCDQLEPDPDRMLEHAPAARRHRPAYLDFLIGENRLEAAQRLARTMMSDRANDPLLIDLSDRQLRAGDAASAIELWNAASGFPPLDPSAAKILTNGDLARAPLNLGFDWRMGQTDGIRERWRPSELVFTLSGSQPETCVLLEQTVSLVRRHFRLRFDYMTADPSTTGISWALDDVEGPPIEPSGQWKEGRFKMPAAEGVHHLRLFYRREPGTTRAEGQFEIRNLRLEETT